MFKHCVWLTFDEEVAFGVREFTVDIGAVGGGVVVVVEATVHLPHLKDPQDLLLNVSKT